jgi:hypothetical protein
MLIGLSRAVVLLFLMSAVVSAQPPGGPGGRGFGGFPGGPPGQQELKLVKEFDKDNNGWLNTEERQAARKKAAERPRGGRPGFGPPRERGDQPPGEGGDRPRGERGDQPPGPPGPPPGGPFGRNREPAKPGRKLAPGDVESYAGKPLYDPAVFRTLFIDFESDDWEAELAEFKHTDVEVPATLTVDGKKYPNIGVKFRGMSSFMGVSTGYKRSLNLSVDYIDKNQRLEGYKTLNLLNCNGDPSMMSTVLYSQIAREHIAAPKANFVQVVINGECWGVYTNVQQVDATFIEENFGSPKGTRWKVKGSPGGDGGLRYLGDKVDEYKSRYDKKSGEAKDAWQALMELCRVLKETPDDELEAKLEPILDIEEVLWFLAYDNALVNSDGYWTRASDYYLYRDEAGKFRLIPHDMNEAFQSGGGPPMGPGGPGGPGGFGPRDFRRGPGPGPGGEPGFSPDFGPPPDGGPPGDERPRREGPPGRDGEEPPRDRPRDEREGRDAREREPRERNPDGPAAGDQPPRQRRFGRGPGGPGGMMHGGPDLDPLIGLDNERTPLRGRLLKLPKLREKYLAHVREIAEGSLDWSKLGPTVAKHRQLIEQAVQQDTRKLMPFEAFEQATSPDAKPKEIDDEKAKAGRGRGNSLRKFADERREFLLKYKAPTQR